ncbi:MAG: DUF1501 domain-containing protein [Acidobacteriia bacterium]|nr:DUF1501 domain-containing protein [Terriglobia bacterium]
MRLSHRRRFLRESACGLGSIALSLLLAEDGYPAAAADPLREREPHFEPSARNVIFLFQAGGPSQLDLLDPKPSMRQWDGQPLPDSLAGDLELAFIKPDAKIWASPRRFDRHGESGLAFSELLPHTARSADDLCVVRSMTTDQINHHTGQLMMACGTPFVGHPSMGAWVTYGLGSESRDLPGFVVLNSGSGADAGSGIWSSGFLPSSYQGVPFRSTGDAVLHLSNPPGYSRASQRARLDALRDLNAVHRAASGDPEVEARIASYELAFRMQMATPELLDFSGESEATLDAYGVNEKETAQYGRNCLLARRMVERGVRFVQIVHASWDHHAELRKGIEKECLATDKPSAALVADLKERGLLDSTLVVWGGEFGRTPMVEDRTPSREESRGRDHHRLAFSMWLAGGGIRPGCAVGQTDELGLEVAQDPVAVNDLQATVLHCLGLDHTKLTFRHQGRDFRLTDVRGNVVRSLLA